MRDELNRVLNAHEFRSSKRSQDFLRYVVEHTLAGRTDALKERTIGIEVFGRPTSYDPSDDATVRVKAGEVRKRLSLYYASVGIHDSIRIELPGGTYVPEFRQVERPHEAVLELATREAVIAVYEPPPVSPNGDVVVAVKARKWRRFWIASLPVAVVLVAGLVWYRAGGNNHALDRFWSPVLDGQSPVTVCASYVPVYSLNRDSTMETPVRAEEFTLLTDQFVGGGDMVAVSRLSAMLTRWNRPYRVRIGNEISFRDLRSAPAILVGFAYTRWKEISSEMRYFIDGSRNPVVITDNGKATRWSLPNLPANRHTSEDYAIVSRVFHPDTHAMLVEIAGITQYGTDAAADLVTNPELLGEALSNAPSGWQHKNLQFVLHVKVVSETPSSPRVIAAHFW